MNDWLDAEADIDPRKILDYLLSPDHPEGQPKAQFFEAFGFAREDWHVLAEALLEHRREGRIVDVETTPYGEIYAVEGELFTPDGCHPFVRSMWRKPPGQSIKLVTAYPVKEGSRNA